MSITADSLFKNSSETNVNTSTSPPASTPSTAASPSSGYVIPPIPEQVFDSYEEAEAALHSWNRLQVIDVTKAHNKKNKAKEIRQRDFQCDHYGKTQNTRGLREEDRIRKQRGTSKIGCKMKIRIEAVDADNVVGSWKIAHLNGSDYHNHPASRDPSFHPGHRRRDMQRFTSSDLSHTYFVAAQTSVGVAPQVVVTTIRSADSDTSIIAKDVSNKKNAGRREALASDTPTELLLRKLEEHDFFYKVAVDPEISRLRPLFWSHPGIKDFYAWNPDVLVLDCTYKKNTYDLPLLNIVVMTNMNTVLPIAQCWLLGEKEEDFICALGQLKAMMEQYDISAPSIIFTDRDQACMNALDRLFPNVPALVCRWHMNRNVLVKTRTVLGQVENPNPSPGQDKYDNTVETDQFMDLYYSAADSPAEADFVEMCAAIRSFNVELAKYLDLHWWKYKAKVVRCWTSQYLHFGYRDTSPVEGTHAKCKRWLESLKGNLLTAFEKLLPWWNICIKNTSLAVERDVGKVSHILQDERYSAVVLFISRYALVETANLWKEAGQVVSKNATIEPCSVVFRRTNGRPCVHDLIEIVKSERQQKLQVQHFHEHWLTRRGRTEDSQERVLEPAPLRANKTKKRKTKSHKKNHGNSGTARDATFSERVDLNHPAPTPSTQPIFMELLMSSDNLARITPGSAPQLSPLSAVINQTQNEEEKGSEDPPYFSDYV